MADIILKPLTALGQTVPLVETLGRWTLTERGDIALASLAPRRDRAAELVTLAAKAGIPLPTAARAVEGLPFSAFWLTPDMWMIEAPFETHQDIRLHLLAIFGDTASITEQTDAWVRFDIAGPQLDLLFQRLTNFDLAVAEAGIATRTVIEHLGCYLIKRSDSLVTLYGGRSSAHSLHHALQVTAASLM